MATIPRGTGSTHFLTLGGVNVGPVKSVAGGDTYADVIVEPVGESGFAKKHIGQPKYEDFALRIGLGLANPVYDWIADTWSGTAERRSGSIVTTNVASEATSERQFTNALVSEVTIPALDGSSKDPAFLMLRLAPQIARTVNPTGKVAPAKVLPQKQWLAANFRLEIAGLDCSRVSKIDAFTVRQVVNRDDVGGTRERRRMPARLEFPNLRITLAESAAKTWTDWFEDFVLKGSSDDSKERAGAIVFLSPDRKSELGRIVLDNVGIFALRHPEPAAADQIRRVVVDLYCERMELKVTGQPAVAPTAAEVLEPALPGAAPRGPR